MLPRKRPHAHSAPNSNGSVGLLLPKQQRRGAEGRASARTAADILAKRNTLFSFSKINVLHRGVRACRLSGGDSPSPGASGARQTGHQARRAACSLPGALSDNSLFRRNIPCSGYENSLFRKVQGIGRKPFKLLPDLASASAEIAETGAKFSKFPVKFPVVREFAAPDRAARLGFAPASLHLTRRVTHRT
jgi:hypothetical protein